MKCNYKYVLFICFMNKQRIEFQGPEWFRLSLESFACKKRLVINFFRQKLIIFIFTTHIRKRILDLVSPLIFFAILLGTTAIDFNAIIEHQQFSNDIRKRLYPFDSTIFISSMISDIR